MKEWFRWLWRIDWELIHTERTDYAGMCATPLRPYFWELWKCKRTGKKKWHPVT